MAVAPQPSTISTTGSGRFDLLIDERRGEVHWQLSYGQLESAVTQAHIHLGLLAIAGGISVFLCTTLAMARRRLRNRRRDARRRPARTP